MSAKLEHVLRVVPAVVPRHQVEDLFNHLSRVAWDLSVDSERQRAMNHLASKLGAIPWALLQFGPHELSVADIAQLLANLGVSQQFAAEWMWTPSEVRPFRWESEWAPILRWAEATP